MKKLSIISGLFNKSPDHIKKLESLGYDVCILDPSDKTTLVKNMKDTEVAILGGSVYLSKEILEISEKLKAAIFVGTGYESSLDVKFARSKNVEIYNAPGANSNGMAEFTAMHILNMWRDIAYQNKTAKNFTPERKKYEEIRGRTIGILGMGNIGLKTAKIMKNGFGCNVIYNSRTQKSELDNEYKFVSFEELLKESDVLVLTLTLNDETKNIISMRELKLMKPDAILVNTSRAHLVNGKDLLKALEEDVIRGASFDGYYKKPLPKSKEEDEIGLISLEDKKFFITPYTGGFTEEAFENMRKGVVENVSKHLSNQKGITI